MKRVTIIPSPELDALKLSVLAGREGCVYEDLTDDDRSQKGYMVLLFGEPHLHENVWFIPQSAVSHESEPE